ncbi:hypothetical protein PSTG_01780 [Puccinia striiformis f. sp. tritici PST-78]|uniref:BED-type domain-containing protein n=1 Tax=Puccinia striiformis f. sp. tritici PST-78 TaxID=1165861 RepID=A0A0L0W0U4_9BASI|nr:hypothetical protein PSTG_01780 [Puccinia striiformis f. sp. tritici PST-78]
MPRNRKRPRRLSPTPSSPQPERSDPRSQSPEPDTIDPDIVVVDDDLSTGAETSRELTDAEELLRAQRKAKNAVSKAYAYYGIPELSTQRDKRGRYMIAYPCNMCNERMHRPTYDSSCSNLLKHVAGCQLKHRDASGNQSLASLGVSGTGDIDPREVNQLCALWCAEAARPFSALSDKSHKRILHPTIVKHLPSAKVVSRSIHMIYTAVQDDYREVLKLLREGLVLGIRHDVIVTLECEGVAIGDVEVELDLAFIHETSNVHVQVSAAVPDDPDDFGSELAPSSIMEINLHQGHHIFGQHNLLAYTFVLGL